MALLNEIIVIIGLSTLVLYICQRVKIPVILGYLLTGMLAGPYGFGLIQNINAVESISEIGIVLLLFTIGLEFSFKDMLRLRRTILLAGTLQVLLSILAVFLIARAFGIETGESVFIGFIISLSSTAIVLKILQDRAEVETPHGNIALGILVFQDIIVVPMMIITPLLSGKEVIGGASIPVLIAKIVGIVLFVIVSARWLVPQVLYNVARTRSREIFLLTIVFICLGVAWLTHSVGLSLALGAFLAGLIISESEYSHQALGNILPFRDIFAGFFFVSIGMLLNTGFLFKNPVLLGLITAGVLVLKSLIAGLSAASLGTSLRTVILVGMSLGQVGEFSFVLSETGHRHGFLSGDTFQIFLAISILTMMATPFLLMAAPKTADLALKLPLPRKMKRGAYPTGKRARVKVRDHVIIVGFGLNGRNLARAAKTGGIPYAIIEMNAQVVRAEHRKGEPIHFGDATHEAILNHVNLKEARAVVVVINDPPATRRIVELVKRMNPKVYLIVRTRYLQELAPLAQLGADEVIPEEFETSIEMFSRVLAKYLLPKDEIERLVDKIRSENYGMLRSLSREATSCLDLDLCLPDVEIRSFRINGESPLAGKTIAQTEMRKKYGVTILALRSKAETISNPDPETMIHAHDIIFVVGKTEAVEKIQELL